MKQINLTIETCGGTIDAVQCPYCVLLRASPMQWFCLKHDIEIPDIMTIPSWCKLEDKEEV